MAWECSSGSECLFSICEALGSSLNTNYHSVIMNYEDEDSKLGLGLGQHSKKRIGEVAHWGGNSIYLESSQPRFDVRQTIGSLSTAEDGSNPEHCCVRP